MDGKEMLELAAKAAGISVKWVRNSGCFYYDNPETGHEVFDPLADDGDALRLVVKLRMSVRNTEIRSSVLTEFGGVSEPHKGDPYAATRRAIVRAAAEIGRNME